MKTKNMAVIFQITIPIIFEWMDFEYQSHFTKQFKNITGINPSDYRAIYQDKVADV